MDKNLKQVFIAGIVALLCYVAIQTLAILQVAGTVPIAIGLLIVMMACVVFIIGKLLKLIGNG